MAWRCSAASNAELVQNLSRAGIVASPRVQAAMLAVDRGDFVRERTCAYEDSPQRIGAGVTISAPVRGSAYDGLRRNGGRIDPWCSICMPTASRPSCRSCGPRATRACWTLAAGRASLRPTSRIWCRWASASVLPQFPAHAAGVHDRPPSRSARGAKLSASTISNSSWNSPESICGSTRRPC